MVEEYMRCWPWVTSLLLQNRVKDEHGHKGKCAYGTVNDFMIYTMT